MIVLLTLTLIAGTLQSSQGGQDPRVAALNNLAKQADQPLKPESIRLIDQGLSADSPAVRAAALFAVMAATPAARADLLLLEPKIFVALSDVSEDVRRQAVISLVTLETATDSRTRVNVGIEAQRRLTQRFEFEPSEQVRLEIIRALAHHGDVTDMATERVLLRALGSQDPQTVRLGVTGLGTSAKSLSRLAPFLRHADADVAINTAQVFGRFPSDARIYVADLQRAADAAPAGPVKDALLDAIRRIRQR